MSVAVFIPPPFFLEKGMKQLSAIAAITRFLCMQVVAVVGCPEGTVHHRDAHAAQNILRRGIAELESIGKTCMSVATVG